MSTSKRNAYKIVGARTWELIRAAYLAGDSATVLAARFGVTAHAIRKRITNEGWSKRDYARAMEVRQMREEDEAASVVLSKLDDVAARAAEPDDALAQLIGALKEATRAVEERRPPEPEAPPNADALERAALNSLGAALSKGRAADARAFVGVAEAMRKRAFDDRERAPAEDGELSDGKRAEFAEWMFEKIAYVAAIMVHQPTATPHGFFELVKRWRAINLGDGAEDAAAKAEALAQLAEHYLNGEFWAMMPQEVRGNEMERWEAMRNAAPGMRGVEAAKVPMVGALRVDDDARHFGTAEPSPELKDDKAAYVPPGFRVHALRVPE